MIKLVQVKPGCISCGTCEKICPKVFQVKGTSQVVSSDFSDEEKILEAERSCPVNVIAVDTDTPKITHKNITYSAQFLQKKFLTHNVYEFYFKIQNFSFSPGQFVMLSLRDKKGSFQRSYSIVEYKEGILKLCIKILEDGRGSQHLMKMQTGKSIKISEAKGVFQLTNKITIPKLFIATGTGIAPIIALIQACPETSKQVLFGVRSEEDVFYEQEILNTANTSLGYALSQPHNSQNKQGRVTDFLDYYISSQNKEIYMCGNPSMIEEVLRKLQSVNYPQHLIHYEVFTAAPSTPKNNLLTQLKRIVFEGEIPYFKEILDLVMISNAAIVLGLPWFATGFRELGDIGWNVLIAVLSVRPLSQIFPNIKIFTRLIAARKTFGILSAVLILAHSYGYFIDNKLNIIQAIQDSYYWDYHNYFFWGILGSLVAFILLITSNTKAVILLKSWWKRIQRLAYLFFVLGAIHIIIIDPSRTVEILLTLIFLTSIRLFAYFKFSITFKI